MTQERSFKGSYAYYALVIIFLANFLNYLDRMIISAVLSDVQKDLNLNDVQAGILWTAFTVGYMVFAPFIGYLSDRYSKPKIFAVCVFLWSYATLSSGHADNFLEMILARGLTGVGEAGCLAVGPSLLADYFPSALRGKAMAIFFLGVPFGSTAGYIIGGQFHQWREAFYWAGIPGIVVAFFVFALVEPLRGNLNQKKEEPSSYTPLLKIKALLLIIFAQAAAVLSTVPIAYFAVDYFQEHKNWPKEKSTMMIGPIALLAGLIGNMLSGYIGDKLSSRYKGIYCTISFVGFAAAIPFIWIGFFADNMILRLTGIFFGFLFSFACIPALNAQIANITAPSQRSMAYAITVFIMHLCGDTISPVLFGWISHSYQKPIAFFLFPLSFVISSGLCLSAARSLRK